MRKLFAGEKTGNSCGQCLLGFFTVEKDSRRQELTSNRSLKRGLIDKKQRKFESLGNNRGPKSHYSSGSGAPREEWLKI